MFLAEYFAKHKSINTIFLFCLLLIGLYVGLQSKKDITPYVEPETLFVRIVYPGVSAREIEQNAVQPLERALQILDTSPNLATTISDNAATMKITFIGVADIKDMKQRAIRLLQSAPGVADQVRLHISEEGPSSVPIYYFVLYRDAESPVSLLDFQRSAVSVQQQALRLSGLSGVTAGGLFPEEIHMTAKLSLLDRYYVSLYEIVQAIQNRNLRLSGGLLDFGTESKNLMTDGGFTQAMDITNLIVRANFENQKIRISDLANVEETIQKNLFSVEVNGGEGIIFGLKMKGGEDITRTTVLVDQFVSKLQKELPQGIKLEVIERRYAAVNSILSIAVSSALSGILIVFFCLLLFFDWRTSFWTTVTIPTTIALTMIYMFFADFSINVISLCAIITVLGMLVDHGIVISENIYQYRLAGLTPMEAMRRGVRQVFMPLLMTVLTTVAAFLPMLSIKGLLGGIIRPLPLIVCAALLLSFFDAVVFLPAHLYHVPKKTLPVHDRPWVVRMRDAYGAFLKKALKLRYLVVMLFLCILGGTVFLVKHMFKTFIFMEPIGVGSLYVQLEAEKGISYEAMKKLVAEVKGVVENAVPPSDRTAVKSMTGENTVWDFSFINPRANVGQVSVYLKQGSRGFQTILEDVQRAVDNSGLTNNFKNVGYDTYGLIPKTKNDLVLRFAQKPDSPDSQDYLAAMQESFDFATNLPGIVKARHTALKGDGQLTIVFDYEKAARLGVDVRTVAETLRIAAGGLTVSKWQDSSKEVSYILKLDMEGRDALNTIRDMPIPNRFMRLIPLREFARLEERPGEGELVRSFGRRMVEFTADVDTRITSPAVAERQIIAYFQKNLAAKYPGAELFSQGESADMKNSFGEFQTAFAIAVAVIYLILLLLFKSPVQPLIVLIAIPFGIVGAVWAFFLHGQLLSFMSFVGIIGLCGVVVNDAIVMVDFINNVVRSNESGEAAALIVEGAKNRFKAVLLTTVTTVAGLLPSIYGLKGVADLIVPITTAMAYGLLFATAVTLVFIPCIYLIGLDVKTLFRGPQPKEA